MGWTMACNCDDPVNGALVEAIVAQQHPNKGSTWDSMGLGWHFKLGDNYSNDGEIIDK